MRYMMPVLFLILTACAAPTPVSPELRALQAEYDLRAITQEAISARSTAIEATRQVASTRAAREVSAAAEAALISTRAAAELQSVSLVATQDASLTTRATIAAAPYATAASWRATEPVAQATTIALQSAIISEQRRPARENRIAWAYTAAIIIFSLVVSYWGALLLKTIRVMYERKKEAEIVALQAPQMIAVIGTQAYRFDLSAYDWYPIHTDTSHQLTGPVTTTSNVQQVQTVQVIDAPPPDEGRAAAIAVINKAIAINGPESRQIPRYDKIGLGRMFRERALDYIEQFDGIERTDNEGTFIRFDSLANLLHQLQYSPTPNWRIHANDVRTISQGSQGSQPIQHYGG